MPAPESFEVDISACVSPSSAKAAEIKKRLEERAATPKKIPSMAELSAKMETVETRRKDVEMEKCFKAKENVIRAQEISNQKKMKELEDAQNQEKNIQEKLELAELKRKEQEETFRLKMSEQVKHAKMVANSQKVIEQNSMKLKGLSLEETLAAAEASRLEQERALKEKLHAKHNEVEAKLNKKMEDEGQKTENKKKEIEAALAAAEARRLEDVEALKGKLHAKLNRVEELKKKKRESLGSPAKAN
eukprot:Nk52_evm1s2004 gene=Nk52_evmTU1s2004